MFLAKYHLHVLFAPFAPEQRDSRPELIDVKSVHKRLTGMENKGPAAVRQRNPGGFKDQTDESNWTELHQGVAALLAFPWHLPSNPSLAEAKEAY